MEAKLRPKVVLAIAILEILFGADSCVGDSWAFPLYEQVETALAERAPCSLLLTGGSSAWLMMEEYRGFLMAAAGVMLLVHGKRLLWLRVNQSGRFLSIACSVFSLLAIIAQVIYVHVYVVPIVSEFHPATQFSWDPIAYSYARVRLRLNTFTLIKSVIFPILVLAVLYWPKVTRAFKATDAETAGPTPGH